MGCLLHGSERPLELVGDMGNEVLFHLVQLVQPCGHRVEIFGQECELIVAGSVEAVVELTFRHSAGPFGQVMERLRNRSDDEEGDKEAHHQCDGGRAPGDPLRLGAGVGSLPNLGFDGAQRDLVHGLHLCP